MQPKRTLTLVTNTINNQFDRNDILTIYVAIPYQGFVRKARLPFVADNLSKRDQSRIINFIDQMNCMEVINMNIRTRAVIKIIFCN